MNTDEKKKSATQERKSTVQKKGMCKCEERRVQYRRKMSAADVNMHLHYRLRHLLCSYVNICKNI